MLDPLPRWVRADVLSTGDLTIAGRRVPGEGAHARRVQERLLAGADRAELAALGVGWVVVEGGHAPLPLPVAYRDDDVAVYAIGGTTPASPHRALMIAAHLVWLAQLGVGLGAMAVCTSRRADRRDQQSDGPARSGQ